MTSRKLDLVYKTGSISHLSAVWVRSEGTYPQLTRTIFDLASATEPGQSCEKDTVEWWEENAGKREDEGWKTLFSAAAYFCFSFLVNKHNSNPGIAAENSETWAQLLNVLS